MSLLAGESLSKAFNDQVILDDVSFTIRTEDRIGLVGRNGIGKTTFFELLAGKSELDAGSINRAKNCRIEYIEQEQTEYYDDSLFDFVAAARPELHDLRHKITDLETQLSYAPDDEKALEELGQLQQLFEIEGGFGFEDEIKRILMGLGFVEERFEEPLRQFSGGEKNRAALARVLAGKGTLLLLDEPTNHLDIDSTVWLEEYLKSLDKAYVVVSHDRSFLTATVNLVWEMAFGKLDTYTGGFEKYLVDREERRRLHEHRYRHQQEEIKRLEDYVRRNMAGQKSRQAKSKLKHLGRIQRIARPRDEQAGASIDVKLSGRSYEHVLSLDSVSLGYNGQPVVRDIHFDIYRGDKVGLIGRNGSGKSTILKALIGELEPLEGEIRLGNNVDVAYFDQELSDLDEGQTVIDSLWEKDVAAEAGTIRSALGRFGFSGEDSFKKVSTLSGGEKTKLSLARLLYHPANFIIFDEPTNHLDIDSREALEDALRNFDGSFLIVSHDRHFLDAVVDRTLWVNYGRVRCFDGNYSYFREKIQQQALADEPEKVEKDKTGYESFKERSKARARLKKQIEQARAQIQEYETELTGLVEAIDSGIPRNDWEKLQQATRRKNELEDEILNLYTTLEELELLQREDED